MTELIKLGVALTALALTPVSATASPLLDRERLGMMSDAECVSTVEGSQDINARRENGNTILHVVSSFSELPEWGPSSNRCPFRSNTCDRM